MSLAIKLGAGAAAVVAATTIGVCYLPQIKPDKISAKPLVEQPVFVAVSGKPQSPPPATTVAAKPIAVASTDAGRLEKAGLVSLAAAMKANPAAPVLTRSLASLAVSSSPASVAVGGQREASDTCARGLAALGAGDLAAARAWLQRAADLGDRRALIALGDAYNPAILTRLGVLGAPGDPERARGYYKRALNSGLEAARGRLASLAAGDN